jgi:hypothetical protein
MSEWSALLTSFWHTAMLHLHKPGLRELCAWVHGVILQNPVFIWSFWLKNVINTIYFVKPIKCDLNPKVSINTVQKMSGGHGHPFPLLPIGTPLSGCRRMSCFVGSFLQLSFLF